MRAGKAASARRPIPGLACRRAALWVLERALAPATVLAELFVRAEHHYLLAPCDRALMRAMVLAALRERRLWDEILAQLMDRPLAARHRRIRHVLHLGLAQILALDLPAHAAVSTTVALAGGGGRRQAAFVPLVNAVLRRAVRERNRLQTLRAAYDPLHLLPDWLARRWGRRFGTEQARSMARILSQPAPLDLVARDDSAAALLAARLDAEVLPGGVLRLAQGGDVSALPGYEEGLFWVQDWAATLPARLLDTALGARGCSPEDTPGPLLDLCAAPGGKTAQLAAAGWPVVAVDISPVRLGRLRDNLARLQLEAMAVAADAARFAAHRPFAGVLLDAPCSATGTARRHPDILWKRTPEDIRDLAARQRALLENAARLVAPGGVLVYAVCSLEPEEGEDRIADFLARHPDFRRQPVATDEVFGLAEAVTGRGDVLTHPAMLADEGGIDGFYIARLARQSTGASVSPAARA